MIFMLDTNAVSALMKGNSAIDKRVRLYGEHQIGLSAMVFYELQRGASQESDTPARAALQGRIRRFPFELNRFRYLLPRSPGNCKET